MKPENIIKVLENIRNTHVGSLPIEEAALSDAIGYAGRWIPKKVIWQGEWSAVKCPACGSEELSFHQGDGVYEHRTWLEYCPNDECHQKLDWKD